MRGAILFASLVAGAPIGTTFAGDNMKIQINDKIYNVQTEDNDTVADIVAALPLTMDFTRYAGHEYFSDLTFRPRAGGVQTSELMAGHLYYWGGGNAFVINFADYDIAPYHSVHLGRILDADAVEVLRNAPDKVSIKVLK